MADGDAHVRHVSEWMRHLSRLSPDQLAALFEKAMTALWHRTYSALGDITVAAILDRVLYTAKEKYPVLGTLKSDANGIDFAEFREQATSIRDGELRDAIRFVLVELLTVVGNLTAEILTPALHSELSSVTVMDPPDKEKGGKTL